MRSAQLSHSIISLYWIRPQDFILNWLTVYVPSHHWTQVLSILSCCVQPVKLVLYLCLTFATCAQHYATQVHHNENVLVSCV